MNLDDLQPGRLVRFEYPIRNFLDEPLTWTYRRIVIERVIDLANSPLNGKWIRKRPQIRRGRYLVIGFDLDREAKRSYYLEAMRGQEQLAWLSLCLFDPINKQIVEQPIRYYPPEVERREFLARLIRRHDEIACQQEDSFLTLCVLPTIPHEHQSLRTLGKKRA